MFVAHKQLRGIVLGIPRNVYCVKYFCNTLLHVLPVASLCACFFSISYLNGLPTHFFSRTLKRKSCLTQAVIINITYLAGSKFYPCLVFTPEKKRDGVKFFVWHSSIIPGIIYLRVRCLIKFENLFLASC